METANASAAGPALPPDMQHDCPPLLESEDELWNSWTQAVAHVTCHTRFEVVVALLKEATLQTVLHLDEVKELFVSWRLHFQGDRMLDSWSEVCNLFLTSATTTWFVPAHSGETPRLSFEGVFDQWCERPPSVQEVLRVI